MALTKVTGQVINSTTDLSVGVATVGGGTSTGDLYVVGVTTFASDVSIGGTLTYEDVTNVDSVGLITARKGISVTGVGVTIALGGLNVNAGISTFNDDIKVGSGITLSPDGDSYYTGITTIATKLGIGSVHLGGTATDALLTIKGDTNVAATPSIRLLDGADAREVSITNTSGDFVASVHGADNTVHGHLKLFESGIVQFSNGGASGSITERLRISVDGQVGISSATPDAWHSTYTSLQIHDAAVLYGSTDDSFVGLGANHFLNTSGDFKYSKTDFASRFYQVNGEFVFENVASGTAGNTLSFTERLKIDINGQVKIGYDGSTTAGNFSVGASDDLKIYHTGDDSYISNSTNTGLIIRNLGNSNIVIQTQNSYPITMKTNGEERLTLGPSGDLTLKAAEGTSANLYLIADQGDDNGDGWRIGSNQDDNDLTIAHNDSGSYVDIVRLIHKVGDTSTNMFVWGQGVTDNNQAQVTVKGTTTGGTDRHSQLMVAKHSGLTNLASAMRWQSDDGTTRYLYMDDNVQVRLSGNFTDIGTTSGTVIGSQSSDIRLKDLVGDGSVPYGLSEINQINPIRFKYKKIGGNPDRVVIGFSAQQVKPIIPEAVYDTGEEVEGEENMLGMDYVNIIPALVNSIKELSAENTALKARLDAAGL